MENRSKSPEKADPPCDARWKGPNWFDGDASATAHPPAEHQANISTRLLVLTPNERRSLLISSGVALIFFLLACQSFFAVPVAVLTLVIVRMYQTPDARWPFTLATMLYAAYFFYGAFGYTVLLLL
jgi:hypothetical protein